MSHAAAVCHGEFGRAALYRLDKPMIVHAHREGHLIFFVGGAKCSLRTGDSVVQFSHLNGAAVSPWEPHSFSLDEEGEALCLTFYIKPMWFLENSTSAEFALQFGRANIRVTHKIADRVRRLTALLMEGDAADVFDALLLDITRISYQQSWQGGMPCPEMRRLSRFSDYRVRRSLRLMQEQLAEDVEMLELAREVGLSRPHFFKLFKKQMGVTPNLYLSTLRAEQAIEDLLTTEKSVTDIAYDLGFSSQASFTRFFSSNVGISPSEYRRVAHNA